MWWHRGYLLHNFCADRLSGGFSPNRWNITLLWLFSCPVLSFFSSSNAQLEPRSQYSRFMAQMTWFSPRTVLLEVRMISDNIWEKCAPKTYPKGAWICIFKPNCQNLTIAVSPKPYIWSVQNLMTKLTPSMARRGWSITAVHEIQHGW